METQRRNKLVRLKRPLSKILLSTMFILGYSFGQQAPKTSNSAVPELAGPVTTGVELSNPGTKPESKYVKTYRPLADSLEEEYGIPAAVILGVAILESGSGTSKNARSLNNHFGIVGKNKLKDRKSRYKQYESVHDSYKDFCKVLKKKKFYKNLKGNMDYKLWVDHISKSGYSEVPDTWKQRVLSTIKKNKLDA